MIVNSSSDAQSTHTAVCGAASESSDVIVPSLPPSLSLPLYRRTEAEEEDLSEFLNDGSWKRGYNTNRYIHTASTLCYVLPITSSVCLNIII